MPIDPKQFLRAHSTPLGLVESEEGREVIRFEDAAAAPCSLSIGPVNVEPAGLNALPPPVEPSVRITQGQSVIVLDVEKAKALSEALQRWVEHKSFSLR